MVAVKLRSVVLMCACDTCVLG